MRRRTRSGSGTGAAPATASVIIDLESDAYDDRPSRHRTCWKHALASLQARPTRPSKHQLLAIDRLKRTFPCYLTFPHRQRSRRHRSPRNKELDTRAFSFYLDNLWTSFPHDQSKSFICLDSLWFTMYLKPWSRSRVLPWIKSKQIFSKKYVLVPIVRWGHWSLLILCHLGESLESGCTGPCMLLLDSLEMAGPRRLEPDIRKFVLDIFIVEGRHADKQLISQIPLLVPKVPQQTNGEECGIYVLFFISLFVHHAPDTFSLDCYPYFMQDNWFSQEGLGNFRMELQSLAENSHKADCARFP